ncbi:MAG: Rieske (2Fe-2S) protein [Anaerolineae bacterium]
MTTPGEATWIDLLPAADLPEGARRVVRARGQDVLLLRQGGQVYAVAARCPHMGAPLDRGTVTPEGSLVCPWHHSAFNLRTGDVEAWTPWPPAVGRVLGVLRRERALPVFPVQEEAGRIWIRLESEA